MKGSRAVSIDPEVAASIARSMFRCLARHPRNSAEIVAFVSMTVRFPDIPWRTPIVVQLYREDGQTVDFESARIFGEPHDLARRLAAYDLVPEASEATIATAERAAKLARKLTIDCASACENAGADSAEIPVGFALGGPGDREPVAAEWEMGRREGERIVSSGREVAVDRDYRQSAFELG